MTRPWLTDGNIELMRNLIESASAHFDEPVKSIGLQADQRILRERQKLLNGSYSLNSLQGYGITMPINERNPLKMDNGETNDQSSFSEPEPWARAISEDMVATFGRGGSGAITSIAEALLVVNTLAHMHGADRIYYRGEHQYGYELKSRAQRILESEGNIESRNGITEREIFELRRFQEQVKNCDIEIDEAKLYDGLPDDNDPEWLPIMQHYDKQFGTRLLDITSSIFTAIHFACIDWDGNIDLNTDGLLYMFFGHGRYYRYKKTGTFDDEISEFVPTNVEDLFKDWRCPEYMHSFTSRQSSSRELAQDGHFFVQSDLSLPATIGGRAQFKICIPSWAKIRLIKELWLAGYTPERIVRGSEGKIATSVSSEQLSKIGSLTHRW